MAYVCPRGSGPATPLAPLALVVLLVLLVSSSAKAQVVDSTLWGTDGDVDAVVRAGNTVYIGGVFNIVGPSTGGGVPLNRSSGAPVRPFPKVTGYVYSVAADGEGGWFIGGDFRAVGGLPRSHLAHILADGSVASWAPNPDGYVPAMLVRGGTVYVGGAFTSIGGKERHYIAALNATTGAATKWNPSASSVVRALTARWNTIYAGGDFDSIGGQLRSKVGAVDAISGDVTSWNPGANYYVWSLAVYGNTILVGGEFSVIAGQSRYRLAAIDANSGIATAWDPKVDGPTIEIIGQHPVVYALAVDGGTVYVGGNFSSIGVKARNGLAAVDARTGLATDWNPSPGGDLNYEEIYSIAVSVHTVFVGGYFTNIGGKQYGYAAELDAKTGAATNWNPRPSSSVHAIAVHDDVVYAGGTFTTIWNWEPRNCLAALNATTGAVTPWDPNQDGYYVTSLAVTSNTVFIGGTFTSVAGQARIGLAAVDAVTGAVKDWRADADAPVLVLEAEDSTLYVGGNFNSIGGIPRGHLAALDVTTGAVNGWDPKANSSVFAIAKSGNTIYVGGLFDRIGGGGPGGLTRRFLAAVDTLTGALTPWNPNADLWVNALAVSGNVVYAGGRFSNIGGKIRNNIAALDTASGTATSWDPNANGEVQALAARGNTIYAGGWFENIGGERRISIAALDTSTGTATAWNARGDRIVRCMTLSGDKLYAGGTFGSMGLIPTTNLAAISVPSQVPFARIPNRTQAQFLAMAPIAPNPARLSATIRFSVSLPSAVNLTVYDLQGRRVATLLDHVPQLAGAYVVPIRTSDWQSGFYLCRLEAGGVSVTRKILIVQ